MDQPPAASLPGVQPPVARIIEQLKDVAGPIDGAGVGDHQDLLRVALVAGQERLDVVVVERPETGGDDAVGPVGGELPLILPHEARAPEVQVGQRHLGRTLGDAPLGRVAVAVVPRPDGGEARLGLGQIRDHRLMNRFDRSAGRARVRLLLRSQEQRHPIVHLGQPQIGIAA